MREVTIRIPEGKFQFVMELLRSLKFVKIDKPAEQPYIITEEQKRLVEEEYRKFDENPNYGLDWEEVQQRLRKISE